MKLAPRAALGAAILLMFAGGGIASAHANLTHCSIRNHQSFRLGHAPRTITANFAEDLVPGKSWMAVFEGQADHGLVTEKQHSVVPFSRPKNMVLHLPRLRRERYYLLWYTRSAIDNHVAAGIVYFQVR
jgi:methionine-rich copper-binding protein CopC